MSIENGRSNCPRKQSFLGRGRAAYDRKRQTLYRQAWQCFLIPFAIATGYTKFLVPMRPGETPVPIPNTMVKPRTADDTTLETAWESRWVPDPFKNNRLKRPLDI